MKGVLSSILALVCTVVLVAVPAAILFISAGRWDLPFLWAYIWFIREFRDAENGSSGAGRIPL